MVETLKLLVGFSFIGSTSNVAGTVLGVIFCLLLAAVIVLAIVYFTRRPYKLPAFLLKLRSRASTHRSAADSVAFENPGYDREGQVGKHFAGKGNFRALSYGNAFCFI